VKFDILDCFFRPLQVLRELSRLQTENEFLRQDMETLKAADAELVNRLQLVIVPGSVAVLSKETAKRIVRGGIV
jgi:hypothetical protein